MVEGGAVFSALLKAYLSNPENPTVQASAQMIMRQYGAFVYP